MYSLYEYYKKISGLYNLVFRYIPIPFFGVIIFNIITALVGIFIMFKMFIGNSWAQFFVSIAFIALFFASLWFLALSSRRVLRSKYKTDTKGINIGTGVYGVIQTKITDKLIELNWYTPSKVEKLAIRYEKQAENLKFKIPVIPSVFVMLFIPLWTQFIGWIYRNVNTFEEGMKIFCVFAVIIVTVAVVLLVIKSFFENVFLEFLNRDYYLMKNLSRRLEDIFLEMNEKPRLDVESNESIVKISQRNKKKTM